MLAPRVAAARTSSRCRSGEGHADPGFALRTYVYRMDEGSPTPTSSTPLWN
jgi:hypothetical protein